MTRHFAALLVGLGASATALAGQETGRFQVTPTVGVIRFDRTSALSSIESGLSTRLWPSVGLSALYGVRKNVQVGLYAEGGRADVSPDYYPYVLIRTAGTYELNEITQRVVVVQYGLAGAVDYSVTPKLAPYVRAGVGRYTVFTDVQRLNSTASLNGTEIVVGGGVSYQASAGIRVRLEAMNYMWADWDRDALNPTDPAFQNTVFPELNPPGITWSKPSLIHNIRLGLGVAFTPSATGTR